MTSHDTRLRQAGSLPAGTGTDPAAIRYAQRQAAEQITVDEDGLTAFGQQLLVFEGHWWRHAGAKDTAVRDTFDMSSTRYYQLLNWLIDQPEAYVADPLLVKRLHRLRDDRRTQRSRRRGDAYGRGDL